VAPASPIECLLYLPNVRAIQYKLGPERLTRLAQCPGDTVQTGTGKVDPARKFKCTTAARVLLALEPCVAQGSHGW